MMPYILDKHTEGLELVHDIFIGGVTFYPQGGVSHTTPSSDFNEFGELYVQFSRPERPHSNCHRSHAVYQQEVIARYK